jgi:Insect pheromone-binding family, A10/OS-D
LFKSFFWFLFYSLQPGILPEALRTKCAKCSIYQKENALKIITALYYQYPENYKRLGEKWDPTGEYNKRFEEYLANKEFNQIGSDDAPPPPPPPSTTASSVGE